MSVDTLTQEVRRAARREEAKNIDPGKPFDPPVKEPAAPPDPPPDPPSP